MKTLRGLIREEVVKQIDGRKREATPGSEIEHILAQIQSARSDTYAIYTGSGGLGIAKPTGVSSQEFGKLIKALNDAYDIAATLMSYTNSDSVVTDSYTRSMGNRPTG